jgi:small subunit ribosomal protein S2
LHKQKATAEAAAAPARENRTGRGPRAAGAGKTEEKKSAGPTVVKANKTRKLVAAGTADLVEIEAELNENKPADDSAE